MAAVTDNATTETEEMYLITIAMAVEEGHEGPVPVPKLADALGVSKVSANEMIKKLAARHLVEYLPYKGAELSSSGEQIARTILRRRRLWSLFLSENLGLSPSAADAVACEFEHITPGDVARRLSEFLGDPTVGPQGKPIPEVVGVSTPAPRGHALSEVPAAKRVDVTEVTTDAAGRSFLADQGIRPGARLEIIALGGDGSRLIKSESGTTHLSAIAAAGVLVIETP